MGNTLHHKVLYIRIHLRATLLSVVVAFHRRRVLERKELVCELCESFASFAVSLARYWQGNFLVLTTSESPGRSSQGLFPVRELPASQTTAARFCVRKPPHG